MNNELNSYEQYLMFQYHMAGDFVASLYRLISMADEDNLARLEEGFPDEVDAYRVWTGWGRHELYSRCSPEFLESLRQKGCIP